MAVEARRGCGHRKVGGLYIVSDGNMAGSCGRLPIELSTCPCCGGGFKQSRGWSWIDLSLLLDEADGCGFDRGCGGCPISALNDIEQAGLLWVGAQYYPTPESFLIEARKQGISKRLPKGQVPKDLVLGETWVMLAHPKAVQRDGAYRPGIFSMFRPSALEQIVTESQSKDPKLLDSLEKRGIRPVIVPDDDPDHR